MTNIDKEFSILLKSARAGNRESLNLLCKKLESILRGYFWEKFKNKEVVDDLSQETYIRLLKNLSNIREPMKLRSFLIKVAIHVSQDYLRQKYRCKMREVPESSLNTISDKPSQYDREQTSNDTAPGVLENVDLQQALASLPPKSREIMQMMAEGYKYEEIAEVFKLSVSGVKMQIKRSTEQLRTLFYSK